MIAGNCHDGPNTARSWTRHALDRCRVLRCEQRGAGSPIGYLAAIDRASLAAYELPLREGRPIRLSSGKYPWRWDGDYSSITSIVNVGPTTAAHSAVLTYQGGACLVAPETLEREQPRPSIWV